MTKAELKDLIVKRVTELQGCKATELASDEAVIMALAFENYEISELFDELVKEGQLAEVAYVLPSMEYLVKSFYLPARSKMRIFNGD